MVRGWATRLPVLFAQDLGLLGGELGIGEDALAVQLAQLGQQAQPFALGVRPARGTHGDEVARLNPAAPVSHRLVA